MTSLKVSFQKAIDRRKKLARITNAMRLINGQGDHLDGLLIDRYHRHVHVQLLNEHWSGHTGEISDALASLMDIEYLIVKTRKGLDVQSQILTGTDPETVVEEYGLKFKVHLNDGLNCGLFLDMRANRRMVGESCQGQKIFNGFAYTCSFGVHARGHGAREVVNADISRKILERGAVNYRLNGMGCPDGEFARADAAAFLKRALKKENRFDVIILDPPSFARHEGGVFQVKRDLPGLMSLAAEVLNPKGRLFVSTNYSEIAYADLEQMLGRGLHGRRVEHVLRVGQDDDFPGTNSFKESYLAGLWVKFL